MRINPIKFIEVILLELFLSVQIIYAAYTLLNCQFQLDFTPWLQTLGYFVYNLYTKMIYTKVGKIKVLELPKFFGEKTMSPSKRL